MTGVLFPPLAQLAQHLEAVLPRHAPVEQDRVGHTPALEKGERLGAAAETRHGKTFVDEIEAERFAERVVVVHEHDPRAWSSRRGGR